MQTEKKERKKGSLLDDFRSWLNLDGKDKNGAWLGDVYRAVRSLLKRAEAQGPEEEQAAPGENVEEKKQGLTREELEALLNWLDPDRTVAAEKCATIQAMLIRFFAQRRCQDADSLADDTIDRVARNVLAGKETQGKREQYFMGVARNVALEMFRKQQKHETGSFDDLTQGQQSKIEKCTISHDDSARQDEQRDECMRHCLDKLEADEAEMIVIYSAGKHELRRKLAEFLEINVKALRHRILRLRGRLDKCVNECLEAIHA